MKAADAAAIRKSLGCIRLCKATGPRTHHPNCSRAGDWSDVVPATSRSREASVPVSELEELVTIWRGHCDGYSAIRFEEATATVQALIDRVTP